MRKTLRRAAWSIAVLTTLIAALVVYHLPQRAPRRSTDRAVSPQLLAALRQPASLDVTDASLDEVLKSLGERYDVDIRLDRAELNAKSPYLPVTVSVTASDVSLGSLLELVLDGSDLTTVLDGAVVTVTSRKAARLRPVRVEGRVYPMPRETVGFRATATRRLSDFLHRQLQLPSGRKAHGVASLPHALSVQGTPSVHATIEPLLAELFRFQHIESQPESAIWIDDGPYDRLTAVTAALQRPIDVSLDGIPLREALSTLSQLQGVPIVLDRRTLRTVNSGAPDGKIALELREVTLESALRLMLEPFGLTLTPWADMVLVTTADQADERLLLGLYGIRDLPIDDGHWLGKAAETSNLKLSEKMGDALVVCSPYSDHRRIQYLLAELRRATDPLHLPDDVDDGPGTIGRLNRAMRAPSALPADIHTLGDLARHVRRAHGVNVALLPPAAADGPVDVRHDVNAFCREHLGVEAPLDDTLCDILDLLDLGATVRHQALIIGSFDDVEQCDGGRCVDLRPYLQRGRIPAGRAFDGDAWSQLTNALSTHARFMEGGWKWGGTGVWLVNEFPWHVRRMESLLAALDDVCDRGAAVTSIGEADTSPELRDALNRELDRVVDVYLGDEPLDDAVARLAKTHGLPIRLHRALAAGEHRTPQGVLRNVSLRTALRRLQMDRRGGVVIENGAVVITRCEVERKTSCARIYLVNDLIDAPAARGDAELLRLTEAVAAVVNRFPDPDVYGEWPASGVSGPWGRAIIYTANDRSHSRVAATLDGLRQVLAEPVRPKRVDRVLPGVRRIEAALADTTSRVWGDEPLDEVLRQLSRDWRVHIAFDAHDENGRPIVPETKVNCTAHEVSRREALELIAKQIGPQWTTCIDDGVVLFTAQAEGPRGRQPWLCDVRCWAASRPVGPHRRRPFVDPREIAYSDAAVAVPPSPANCFEIDAKLDFANFAALLTDDPTFSNGVIRMHHGILMLNVRPHTWASLEKLFRDLPAPSDRWPHPDALVDGLNRAEQAQIHELLQAESAVHRAYGLYLLEHAPAAPLSFATALVAILRKSDPVEQAALHLLACRAVARMGPRADEAALVLADHWPALPNSDRRRLVIDTLVRLGPVGVPVLGQFLDTDRDDVFTDVCRAMGGMHDQVDDVLPVLWRRLDSGPTARQKQVGKAIAYLDPHGTVSHRILADWQRSDDEATRLRAQRLFKELHPANPVN